MPRSGGNYSLPSGNPVVVGTVIDPSWANNTLSDIGAELTNSVPRDGQAPPTANLPMGGFKHTNAALATASTDYARADQAQSGVLAWLTSVSGTNTITASILPTISSYAVGATYRFVSAGANTGAVTLNINGVGAATVSKFGSTALQAGDIQSGAVVTVTYDGTRFQLVTPATETGLYPAGTANGVLFLDGSKVATSGSGLVFDGTNLGVGTASPTQKLTVNAGKVEVQGAASGFKLNRRDTSANAWEMYSAAGNFHWFNYSATADAMLLDASGNLGLGVTPSAWGSNYKAAQVGIYSAISYASGASQFSHNAYNDNTNWRYAYSDVASMYQQVSGVHQWFTAPSGTAGNAITFTQAMTLDANRNLGLNTSTFGTSAAGVLALGTGTAPTTGPADTVQLFSVDRSAGNTIPAIRCEGSGVTNAGITNTTVTNKIAVQVNGTIYYLLATTNAT